MDVRKLSERQRDWLEHVEACAASGGSMKAYAESRGLDLQSFYLWKGRLKKLRAIESNSGCRSVDPVRVVSPVLHRTFIQLANGVNIEAPHDVDGVALCDLLKAAMRL